MLQPHEALDAFYAYQNRMRADYAMSKDSRFNRRRSGLATYGGSGDYHIRVDYDFYHAIEKARDMDRNDAIIGQMLTRAADNEIQDGFNVEWNTGDKMLDRDLKARWHSETDDPEEFDIAGEHCFHDFQWYAARLSKLDGDCGVAALWDENKFQFIEAHSIYQDTGNRDNIINGVELDDYRRRVRYYIAQDELNPWDTTRQDSQPIDTWDGAGVRQFFHIYNGGRVTLSRGVSCLAPCFELAGMLEDLNFANLAKAQAASFIFLLETGGSSIQDLPSAGGFGIRTTEQTSIGPIDIDNPDSPGMRVRVPKGSDLKGFSSNIPNAEYFEQASLILRMISVNIGLPLMMALLDGSDSTFHGYRGALDEARRGFQRNQRGYIKRLHRPLTKWKLHRWQALDPAIRAAASRSDINLFNFEWTAPGWPYVEPTADATGDEIQLRSNLNSPRRIQKNRGRDHEAVTIETIEDNQFAISNAIKAAQLLNSQIENDADKVHWRDLINKPTSEGVTVSQSTATQDVQESSMERLNAHIDYL